MMTGNNNIGGGGGRVNLIIVFVRIVKDKQCVIERQSRRRKERDGIEVEY